VNTAVPPSPGGSAGVRIGQLQEQAHGETHDYADGSPHIRHHAVREGVVATLRSVVHEVLDRQGSCRVLEVGAGHGTFTDHIVAAGASVVVTEMSGPSVEHLSRQYRHNDRVQVLADPCGGRASTVDPVDVVVCISVLHHIPDYVVAVSDLVGRIRPGGAFVSFQDPLWYPRRSRAAMLLDRAAYLSWRIPRGNLRYGVGTALRRRRRALDESRPSDMVEYHVLRDGVDEQALVEVLDAEFGDVELRRYWSTQGGPAQLLGAKGCPANTFGLVARHRG
jgi:SAM-dependent methyltransferase